MKRIILMSTMLAGIFISCDTDDSPNVDTPSVVLNAFQSEFPNAKDIEWDENKDGFEVEFEIEKIEHTAVLSSEGNITRYKYDILHSELPKLVNQTIESNYDHNKLDDIEILKIDDETYYQVEFEGNFMDEKIVFNTTGEVNSEIEYLD